MKKINMIKLAVIAGLTAILFTGCLSSSPNPAFAPVSPVTGLPVTNYAVAPVIYSPPPALNNYSNIAVQLAPAAQAILAATPAAPVASFVPTAINWVFGGLGAVFAIIAGWKNNQAAAAAALAAQHQAAAATLAAAVVATPGAADKAVSIAATNGTAGTVATHLASANSPT